MHFATKHIRIWVGISRESGVLPRSNHRRSDGEQFSRFFSSHVFFGRFFDRNGALSSGDADKMLPPGMFSVGSKDELGLLIEEFRPYLLTVASAEFPQEVHGKLGASDIVQETILKGIEEYGQFRGTTREEFAGWLRAILRHQLVNVRRSFRADKRNVALETAVDSQLGQPNQLTASDVASTRERKLLLENAIARLSDADREMIHLRHRDNLTFAEIGIRIQKSEDAARNAWIRAVQRLKQELRRDDSKFV